MSEVDLFPVYDYFAILGLRSMYFVLAGAYQRFYSLGIIAAIIATSVAASIIFPKKDTWRARARGELTIPHFLNGFRKKAPCRSFFFFFPPFLLWFLKGISLVKNLSLTLLSLTFFHCTFAQA